MCIEQQEKPDLTLFSWVFQRDVLKNVKFVGIRITEVRKRQAQMFPSIPLRCGRWQVETKIIPLNFPEILQTQIRQSNFL